MFTLKSGMTSFQQWNRNDFLTNPNMKIGDLVIFTAQNGKTWTTRAYHSDGVIVNVPNEVLTMDKPFTVRLHSYPEAPTTFTVESCDKPKRYVYVDNVPVVPTDDLFIVNAVVATMDEDTLAGTVTTDKPFYEIQSAYLAGQNVVCDIVQGSECTRIPLQSMGSSSVNFMISVQGISILVQCYYNGVTDHCGVIQVSLNNT